MNNSKECLELLLKHGADVNIETDVSSSDAIIKEDIIMMFTKRITKYIMTNCLCLLSFHFYPHVFSSYQLVLPYVSLVITYIPMYTHPLPSKSSFRLCVRSLPINSSL